MKHSAGSSCSRIHHLLFAALTLTGGCVALDEPLAEESSDLTIGLELMPVCDRDFVVHDGADAMALLYCATGPLQSQRSAPRPYYPGYRRLIISQHGRGGDARMYFEAMSNLAAEYREPAFVIAPQLLRISEVYGKYGGVSGFVPGWHFQWNSSWPLGALSLSDGGAPFTRSSYELVDRLVEAAIPLLPDLEEVVIVGQSAGGQLVNRYAASNQVVYPAGVNVRYIPMNPQSWLYLDGTRPYPERAFEGDFNAPIDPDAVDLAKACPNYNDYHTGLEKLTWSYFVDRGIKPSTIISQFKSRKVINMVGELDTEEPDGGFVCRYEVQGANRNERAKAYYAHVMDFYAPIAANHLFFEVAGVSHGHKKMFPSPCGRRWIFDDLAAACP